MVDKIKDLKRNKVTRLDAQIDLLSLAKTASKREIKLIRTLTTFIDKLPTQGLKDEIMETELSHRFIDSFLSPLFDNPDDDIFFRWTSVTNQEAETSESGSISKKRPDSCISELNSLYFDATLGFVEVKPSSQEHNKKALSDDLVRLGMLSKNAIDKWSMRGCISIQVIGYKATFFLTAHPSHSLYTMTELCTIQIPSCIDELLMYLTQVDEISAVLSCYNDWCVHLPPEQPMHKRPTLSDEDYDVITSSPKSNKRRCYTMQ